MNNSIGKIVTAEKFWVWTELTESKHPDRKAGEKVYRNYEHQAPLLWLEKGYIREAQEVDMPEGQTDIFDFIV